MKAKIISDSGNDLPDELLKKYDIKCAPLSITFEDGNTYLDKIELSREEFYNKLINSNLIPKTSQPTPQAFFELIKQTLQDNFEAVVVTLSSGLSGTYESACIAKSWFSEEEQKKIYIIDSLSAATGEGLIAYEAAKMAQRGETGEEIAKTIKGLKSRLKSIFTVDTFEYLVKGGRVTKAKGFLGKVLNIKPILMLDKEGKIGTIEKIRGKKKAVKRLLEIMEKHGQNLEDQTVGIVHSRVYEEALELSKEIKSRFNVKDVIIGELSASIGTHTGPGCIAVFFYS